MRFAYPVTLQPEPEGGFSVSFEDVPEALTQGEDEAEALAMAADALVTALSFYTEDGQPLPTPSPARGRPVVGVPLLVAAKLALHARKLELGLTDAAFARRLGLDQKSASRLIDPLHRSHIDTVEKALKALGRRPELTVRPAA